MNGLLAGGSTAVHIMTVSSRAGDGGEPHPDAQDQRDADGEQGGHEQHVGRPVPAMAW